MLVCSLEDPAKHYVRQNWCAQRQPEGWPWCPALPRAAMRSDRTSADEPCAGTPQMSMAPV